MTMAIKEHFFSCHFPNPPIASKICSLASILNSLVSSDARGRTGISWNRSLSSKGSSPLLTLLCILFSLRQSKVSGTNAHNRRALRLLRISLKGVEMDWRQWLNLTWLIIAGKRRIQFFFSGWTAKIMLFVSRFPRASPLGFFPSLLDLFLHLQLRTNLRSGIVIRRELDSALRKSVESEMRDLFLKLEMNRSNVPECVFSLFFNLIVHSAL